MMPLDPEQLDPDPYTELDRWLSEADAAGVPLANSFALATASPNGEPSVRLVLLRGADHDGLRFYTNRSSRKGRDLATNARAAIAFHWPSLHRQIRAHGRVEQLSDEESTVYWETRPRASRLSAWASVQGAEIASRTQLQGRVAELNTQFPDDAIPLPPFWGGYRIVPEAFEFWEGREDRLHDRVEYLPDGAGGWRRRRLQP
jgi:pyridoxamine 5'-phosphate oxidase